MGSILVTGGCGFIGSNLTVELARQNHSVTALDNLSRCGSEILRRRILDHGAYFQHGDIRNSEDLVRLKGEFDVLVECSAEPSVLVGSQGADARFMINNNLLGSVNCFEFASERKIPVLFVSTSRVYPYDALNACSFAETETRFNLLDSRPGLSLKGVATGFPLNGVRSLYGATKLGSELLLQEYGAQYDLSAIIDRCGVIAGPWQLGKVDQGVFTHWLASHYFGKPLNYIGFGGQGKQVRDLLHIADLVDLVARQIARIREFRGKVFNVGGSVTSNLSLVETTRICQRLTGKTIGIGSRPETRPADVKWYVTDNGETETAFQWRPTRTPEDILRDTYEWLRENEIEFKSLFTA